jgi:hypothetical protein
MAKDIQRFIEDKADEEYTPIQIFKELNQKFKKQKREPELPSLRTVQLMVKEREILDTSGTWSIKDNEPEDAKLILEILANVIILSHGKKRNFTNKEAEWVLKIRKIIPDVSLVQVWRIARKYLLYESQGITSTEGWDAYLAFTPWRSGNHFSHYKNALLKGWAEGAPILDWIHQDAKYAYIPGYEDFPKSFFDYSYEELVEKGKQSIEEHLDLLADGIAKGEMDKDVIDKFFDELENSKSEYDGEDMPGKGGRK